METTDAYRIYEEIIKDNIEYDILVQDTHIDKDRLDEIVTLILETVCTARKTIRVAGDDYPAELVKSKFMKLDSSHIQFVFDCMKENTTKIRNIKNTCWRCFSMRRPLWTAIIPPLSTMTFTAVNSRERRTFCYMRK